MLSSPVRFRTAALVTLIDDLRNALIVFTCNAMAIGGDSGGSVTVSNSVCANR